MRPRKLGISIVDDLMSQLKLSKAFTLMESGPVVLVTTHDGKKDNIMTISWTMVMDFTPVFAEDPKEACATVTHPKVILRKSSFNGGNSTRHEFV